MCKLTMKIYRVAARCSCLSSQRRDLHIAGAVRDVPDEFRLLAHIQAYSAAALSGKVRGSQSKASLSGDAVMQKPAKFMPCTRAT